jgi:hypothetical protein
MQPLRVEHVAQAVRAIVSIADSLASLPGTTPCYVDGYGVSTLGEVAEARAEEKPDVRAGEREATIRMWGYIATHPEAKPWLKSSGRSRAGRSR